MWKMFVLLAVLLSVAGYARAEDPMSLPQFRQAFVDEIHREYPTARVEPVGDDAVEVTPANGSAVTSYLDHAYDIYRQDPSHLADLLKQFVGVLGTATVVPTITADKLLILVRPSSYAQGQAGGPFPGPLLMRPLAGDLQAFVAVDQPNSYAFPRASELRSALRMKNDAIWARALQNTQAELPAPAKAPPKHVFVLTSGQGIASSMLAEADFWDRADMQVGGAPVVAPVSKDIVLITHEGDAKGIAAMRAAAAKSANDPEGLTTDLFVRRNGGWEVLSP